MSPSKPLFNDLAILSTLALKGVLQDTIPGLQIDYHATQALLKSIAEGASADAHEAAADHAAKTMVATNDHPVLVELALWFVVLRAVLRARRSRETTA